MVDSTRKLRRRIFTHWAWNIVFSVYFVVAAYYVGSVTLGIATGLYLASAVNHLVKTYYERKDNDTNDV